LTDSSLHQAEAQKLLDLRLIEEARGLHAEVSKVRTKKVRFLPFSPSAIHPISPYPCSVPVPLFLDVRIPRSSRSNAHTSFLFPLAPPPPFLPQAQTLSPGSSPFRHSNIHLSPRCSAGEGFSGPRYLGSSHSQKQQQQGEFQAWWTRAGEVGW
jgi:hypothetical protein